MSKENKNAEMNDKQLQEVNGGSGNTCGGISNCANFSLRPGVAPTLEELKGTKYIVGYREFFDCNECIHWQRPEGPCKLKNQ